MAVFETESARKPPHVLHEQLEQLRGRLLAHPLYESVRDLSGLRIFMQQHVFAVWDFMSLLKRLQRELTCVAEVWLPPSRSDLCRFVTEIVLSEECDEDGQGGFLSHFELYRGAMQEVGADVRPIDEFLRKLRNGCSLTEALNDNGILPSTRAFVEATIAVAKHRADDEVAAVFLYSREDLIPEMFARLVAVLEGDGQRIPRLLHYLRRHIEIDGGQHGTLAQRLLTELCGGDSERINRALTAACQAVVQRIELWDGIVAAIRA